MNEGISIAEKIKGARELAGLTQAQLAEKVGTTPQNISQYERGIRKPKYETLLKISNAIAETLNIDSEVLLKTKSLYPDLQQIGSQLMKTAYGTDDEYEAFLVVFSRWYKKLSDTDKDSISAIVKYLQKLNSDGKRVAAERIEELAQIPKYQRQQDTPAGEGEEEPEAKK